MNNEGTSESSNRMRLVTSMPLALSGLAICVSLVTGLYSFGLAERLASSDHRAAEQVKSDTARLLASLKSIADKLALASQGDSVEFSQERETMSEFINSPTSFAYRAWIRGKYRAVTREEREEKDLWDWKTWGNFFLHLSDLSSPRSTPTNYATMEVLNSLQTLTDKDLQDIRAYNVKLIRAIASDPVDGHILHAALYERWKKQKDRERAAPRLLECLRDGGVEDPNIDMFIAVHQGDVPAARAAKGDGAVLNMGVLELLDRHGKKLRELGCT